MQKKQLAFITLVCAAGLGAGTANADYDKSVYIGAGIGMSDFKPETNNTGYSIDKKRDFGWKAYLGYDFTKALSIEGYYTDMGEVTLSPNGSIGYKDYGVSGIYYFYKPQDSREGLSTFARLGVGKMINDTSVDYNRDNDTHVMYGAGLEYGLGKGYALRADFDMFDKDAHLITVGVLKRFGESKPVPPKDSDGDSVYDPQDQCPGTHAGEKVDARGCALPRDSDGDGVMNHQDQCPNTAPGEKVDAKGCPLPKDSDSDSDGILDPQDRCPHTAPGKKVDAKGCELKEVIELKGVTFANNSAELVGESDKILDEVAETLKRYPKQAVEIAGYTDTRGSAAYNKDLSARRASAVRVYLVGKGVNADMLTAKGYGEENPVADNGTVEGRARNRRVELHLKK